MNEATKRPWTRGKNGQDSFGIYAANGKQIAKVLPRPADDDFGFADEAIANADLIVKGASTHDALVAALEAVEWAVPTPGADTDGSCPSCYAGKPANLWFLPVYRTVEFERGYHMKVCQLADALEQVK